MKRGGDDEGFVQIVIILLALILVAGGAYYFGTKNKTVQVPVASSNPVVNPTADPKANWKTYSNSQFGFQLMYPTELTYLYDQLKQVGDNLLLQNFNGSKPRKEESSDFQMVLYVSNDTGLGLEKVVKNSENKIISNITIGGEKAIKGTSIQKYEEVPTVWVKHSGYLFTIQLSTPKTTNFSLFDQILSTFQFTK
jgi:hypothetical protein